MTFVSSKVPSKTVLTIAGFDPSSGAGVTADLMVFAAHGLFGTSCITALTVQSTLGVRSTHPVDSDLLTSTLRLLAEDLPPAGIKIGMLATAATTLAVAEFLTDLRTRSPETPVVLDPVLRASSGRELLDQQGVEVLRSRLLPLVDWVTPNVEELGVLTGSSVTSAAEVITAAHTLQLLSRPTPQAASQRPVVILATGGHLSPPDDLLLQAGSGPVWLRGEHIETASTHGTGCALSSALLSRLVEWTVQPEFRYRHEWEEGDLVVWNNHRTLHRVLPYDVSSGRRMRRTSIQATRAA